MSTVDEIKSAAMKLSEDEQVNLYRWLHESDVIRRRRPEDLKREVAIGIEQLDRGQYTTYDDQSLDQLAADIQRRGRERLRQATK
jgi:hypothetical protein